MGTNIFLKTFLVECCVTFSALRKTCPDKIFEEFVPIISWPILWKGKIRFQNYFAATVQYLNECYRTALHCGVKTITISRAKTRGCQSAMFLLCVCILFLFFLFFFFFSVAALRRCWEHPCRNVISIKLQSNFIEITLQQGCFPINLLHIFRTSFRKNTSEGLPLKTHTHTHNKKIAISLTFEPNERLLTLETDMNRKQKIS